MQTSEDDKPVEGALIGPVSGLPSKKGGGVDLSPHELHQRVLDIYCKYNPSKVGQIPDILHKYVYIDTLIH